MCLANLEPQRLVRSREPLRVDGGRRGLQPLDAPAVKTVVPPSVSSLENASDLSSAETSMSASQCSVTNPSRVYRESAARYRGAASLNTFRAPTTSRGIHPSEGPSPPPRGRAPRAPRRASVAQFEGRKRHQQPRVVAAHGGRPRRRGRVRLAAASHGDGEIPRRRQSTKVQFSPRQLDVGADVRGVIWVRRGGGARISPRDVLLIAFVRG